MSTEQILVVPPERQATAARSAFYRQLGRLFFYPKTSDGQIFLTGGANDILRNLASNLPYELPVFDGPELVLFDVPVSDQSVAETYTRLFDNCRGRSAISLYEKDYGNGDAKVVWEEVIRFYEYFGLDYDVARVREWPDHIGIELEFMHYSSFLEAAVPEKTAKIFAMAAGDFLQRHLAKWLPRFCASVNNCPDPGPYAPLASIASAFIRAEMSYFGRTPDDETTSVPMLDYASVKYSQPVIPIFQISAEAGGSGFLKASSALVCGEQQ